jgi:hypothetical protein
MTRSRFDGVLAAGVVACWLLMLTSYTFAEMHWFRGARAGMVGAYAREIDPVSAPEVESSAWNTARNALEDSRHLVWAGFAFAGLAIIGSAAAALRTYRDWRSWHWLTFAVFAPVTGAAWFAIGRLLYGTGRSGVWIPVAAGAVLACALDLRRSGSAGPGRFVAWSVLAIAAVASIVFAVAPTS